MHFDNYAKNNFRLNRNFCKLVNKSQNFKRHSDSKKHKWKLKITRIKNELFL